MLGGECFSCPQQKNHPSITFVVCEEEDFVRERFSFSSTDIKKRENLYNGLNIYEDTTATRVKILNLNGIVDGYFYFATESDEYVLCDADEFDSNEAYYQQTDNGYVRKYTIEQIKEMESFYYREYTNATSIQNISSEITKFNAQVYAHKEKYNNGVLVDEEVVAIPELQLFKYHEDLTKAEEQALSLSNAKKYHQIQVNLNDNTYTGLYYFSGVVKQNIGDLGKGEF